MKKSSHTTWIIVAIVVLAAVGYFFYAGSSVPSNAGLLSSQGTSAGAVGNNELVLLNQISALRIDTSFFSSPVYLALKSHDYTLAIPTVDVGRANPFAPIPGDSPAPASSGTAAAPAAAPAQ